LRRLNTIVLEVVVDVSFSDGIAVALVCAEPEYSYVVARSAYGSNTVDKWRSRKRP
jgi:hypothetical protein